MDLSGKREAILQTEKRRVAQKIFGELDRCLSQFGGQPVALAVSGGLDSRALLEAVARWPKRHEFALIVVTVNHHTRVEGEAECKAVASRARSLGLEAEILNIYPGSKMDEASLRSARYSAIWRRLRYRQVSVLCTAHQKDDNAEGLVMDLFGLGGGAGGASMATQRVDTDGILVRPFLSLERRDLLMFLTSVNALDYFVDPSNQNGTCGRQKARDFLQNQAPQLHNNPIARLSKVANKRLEEKILLEMTPRREIVIDKNSVQILLNPQMPVASLRRSLEASYEGLCPDHDPRNAARAIETIVKKATSLGLIGAVGVDPSGNSITLRGPVRLNFDLPGAKALMTPVMVSLYRNQNELLVQ